LFGGRQVPRALEHDAGLASAADVRGTALWPSTRPTRSPIRPAPRSGPVSPAVSTGASAVSLVAVEQLALLADPFRRPKPRVYQRLPWLL